MNKVTVIPNRVDRGPLDTPRSVDDLITRFWGEAMPTSRVNKPWRPAVDILETP